MRLATIDRQHLRESTKLTTNELFDRFTQRNYQERFLQLLRDYRANYIHRLYRCSRNLGGRPGTRRRRSGYGCCRRRRCSGGRTGRALSRRLGLVFDGVDVVVFLFRVLIVAEDLALHRLRSIVCLILGGQRLPVYDAESVSRTDLDDALGRLVGEEDVLCFDPSYGGGELVG